MESTQYHCHQEHTSQHLLMPPSKAKRSLNMVLFSGYECNNYLGALITGWRNTLKPAPPSTCSQTCRRASHTHTQLQQWHSVINTPPHPHQSGACSLHLVCFYFPSNTPIFLKNKHAERAEETGPVLGATGWTDNGRVCSETRTSLTERLFSQ